MQEAGLFAVCFRLEAKEQELAQATEQYNDACRTYTTELTYVSGEYRYPDAVRYMVHEFELEKVHTLGEAYKAYDEYDWRKKQEMQFVDLKSLLSNANAQLSSLQYQMIMNNVIGSVRRARHAPRRPHGRPQRGVR